MWVALRASTSVGCTVGDGVSHVPPPRHSPTVQRFLRSPSRQPGSTRLTSERAPELSGPTETRVAASPSFTGARPSVAAWSVSVKRPARTAVEISHDVQRASLRDLSLMPRSRWVTPCWRSSALRLVLGGLYITIAEVSSSARWTCNCPTSRVSNMHDMSQVPSGLFQQHRNAWCLVGESTVSVHPPTFKMTPVPWSRVACFRPP